MKKTLILLLLFLHSAHSMASGFYIEGGLSMMESQDRRPQSTVLVATPAIYSDGSTRYSITYETFQHMRLYDINEVRNPYGALSFGYDWKWRAVVIDLQLQHQSSIEVGDHGQNTLRLNVRWYPFSD